MDDLSFPQKIARDPNYEPECNRSGNRTFEDIVETRFGRRALLGSGAAAIGLFAAGAAVGTMVPGEAEARGFGRGRRDIELDFSAVTTSDADDVLVPEGHVAQTVIPWGSPITGDRPVFRADGSNTGAEQEQQVGMHHDGMHYFPLFNGERGNRRGLLVVNHEFIDQTFLHPNGPTSIDGVRPVADEVRKEIAAHGVSVVDIARGRDGAWRVVEDSPYNRRITGGSDMVFTGPVRGTDFLKTAFSPEGTRGRGTLNNCAMGVTPWNTYLTCEENWAGYFFNGGEQPREQTRHGVPTAIGRYGWGTNEESDAFSRFNATPRGATMLEDFRNEPNQFGWVVEIDPFSPRSTPKKRTALGRFAHEGAVFAPARPGHPVVVYSGDDARFEYVYKFVSKGRYRLFGRNDHLLEEGTLFVARFNEDGSGDWIALDFGKNGLTPENGFSSQADILVNARLAADFVGATPMDRPEWGAVHPENGLVYMTMTNNTRRTADRADAPNPRGPNPFGHIVRWREAGNRHEATRFEWDIFLLAGPESDSAILTLPGTPPLDATNIFSSPDGLLFDTRGILWIQTDGNDVGGNDMMLAAVTETGDIRRFLTGPKGCEITGIALTPDRRTIFANVQHPGDNEFGLSDWPDRGGARPRSATVAVSRLDGATVGDGERRSRRRRHPVFRHRY